MKKCCLPVRRIFLVATVIVILVPCLPAAAGGPAYQPNGEVWLISTRQAARYGYADFDKQPIHVFRYADGGKWQAADFNTFRDSGKAAVPTTIFIHGNRLWPNGATRDGWYIYRRLLQNADGKAFRFVIWSWPSEEIGGGDRYDVRVKARYSDMQAYYLAECLHRLEPDVPVNLIGYSFGARAITAGLHILAGGKVAGRGLSDEEIAKEHDTERSAVRVMLAAAAIDAGSLLENRRYGLATSRIDRMLITRNRNDPVLRFYPYMYGRGGPQAAGYVGPYCRGNSCDNVELAEVSYSVGRQHEWTGYVSSAAFQGRLGWYAFLDDEASD